MQSGVETRVLNQNVRRNIDRFPEDFMFQLTKKELNDWRSHRVSMQIIRAFVHIRKMIQDDKNLAQKVSRIERCQDEESKAIWQAIRRLERKLLK